MADPSKWYVTLDEPPASFEQGDIFRNATIPMISAVDLWATSEIPIRRGSLIILTQTCDIPKVPALLLAEVYSYESLVSKSSPAAARNAFRSTKTIESLIRNQAENFFLLPPVPGSSSDIPAWSVVSFRHLHVVSHGVLEYRANEETPVRMASPYKEYLGESFARFMMRVALPEPLDDFKAVGWSKLDI